jgi:hypothetical protein
MNTGEELIREIGLMQRVMPSVGPIDRPCRSSAQHAKTEAIRQPGGREPRPNKSPESVHEYIDNARVSRGEHVLYRFNEEADQACETGGQKQQRGPFHPESPEKSEEKTEREKSDHVVDDVTCVPPPMPVGCR